MSQQIRGYSVLHVKSLDSDRRIIRGIATTPEADRVGDIVEPMGVQFKNPMPLLLHHDATRPVGLVSFKPPTKKGIEFEASFPQVEGSQTLKDRIDEAWASIKAGLIPAVSIGFRALEDGIELLKTGGVRFLKTEVLELSLVTIPANSSALIQSIKTLDTGLAASGTEPAIVPPVAGVSASVVSGVHKGTGTMKTIAEQISSFEASRQAKSARMTEIMTKAGDEGVTLDQQQSEEYDAIELEVKSIDQHLVRLAALEKANQQAARPVVGNTPDAAAASRTGTQVTVRDNLPPGIAFARSVMCQVSARLDYRPAIEIAKERYPDHQALHNFLVRKTAVPAGTTTDAAWASALVYQNNLASEFVEFLRPATIIGKFGMNGIPSLRRVPFNIRFASQTSGGGAWWVAQAKPKPLTSFGFGSDTLLYTKVAAIAVITQELARFSSPSAEGLVRDALRDAIVERLDIDFIDPAQAAVSGTNPASITNGLAALTSAGTSADNVVSDLTSLLSSFLESNINPNSLVLIMPNTLALALSLMTNAFGQPRFPNMTMMGGMLEGLPVIASQYAANASGSGNLVIALNAQDIFLADDNEVTVDASTEASLEMLDNPTNSSAPVVATSMVSMYQTNSIALRAERFINWKKRRAEAVVYMDDVNWGSVGSP